MSFACPIVEVGPVGKHPDADRLEITQVEGCPCITRAGTFKPGDWAVYVPVDATVPLGHKAFEFLEDSKRPNKMKRIKAAKLRGIFSMGLLLPVSEFMAELDAEDLRPGTNVATKIGVVKYEPKTPTFMGGEQVPRPVECPTYDVEQYRKYARIVLEEGEPVSVTEKIHGSNARFLFKSDSGPEGEFFVGSHRTWKRETLGSPWWQAFHKFNLGPALKAMPDVVFYGEVYGPIQDLRYGSPNDIQLALFDAWPLKLGRFADYPHFTKMCDNYDLPRVPEMYVGAYSDELVRKLVSGRTEVWHDDDTIEERHMREGVVIKPLTERWHRKGGRVILKLVSEEYLLRKGGTEYH